MKDFYQLKKNLKKDFSLLKQVKISVLGDSATQFLIQALRGSGYESGYDLLIQEADFNQIELQVFDPSSELYECKPDVVIVFQSAHKLLGKYNKIAQAAHAAFASVEMDKIRNIYNTIQSNLNAKVIFYNFTEIDDNVFGNYANKTASSFLFQLRKLNYELMQFAADNPSFYICDLSAIQNQVGKKIFFHSSVYINTEMVLSIEVLPLVASKTVDLLNAINGKFKKCVILDLDNTTWGGMMTDWKISR